MRFFVGSILMGAVVLAPGRGGAQATPFAPSTAAVLTSSSLQVARETRVTVNVSNQRLDAVLSLIAQQSGVAINYSPAAIPVARRVSLAVSDVRASDAVAAAVQGMGVTLTRIEDGSLLLARSVVVAEGVVTGKIVNAKTKQPVSGATILVDDATKGVTSGDDGSYRLALRAGEHAIAVRAVGYTRQVRRVVVRDDEALAVDFQLEPSTSVLSEVIVTGTIVATERKAVPTPITVVTADDIEKRNITRIEDLFRGQVPGVLVLETGLMRYGGTTSDNLGAMQTSQVYTRGSSDLSGKANPLKTYIDGVELLDPSYLGTIDPKSIERIEIVTGPQAATIYGAGAIGGVMQIFTKKGAGATKPDVTLALRYGALETNVSNGKTPSHDHSLGVAGGVGPAFSYSGNLSYQYQGQWQPAIFTRSYGASVGGVLTQGPVTVSGSVSLTNGANGTAQRGGNSCYGGAATNSGCYASFLEKQYRQEGLMGVSNQAGFYSQQISRSNSQTQSITADYRVTPSWAHHLTVGRSQTGFAMDPQAPIFATPSDTLLSTSESNGQRTTLNYNTTWRPVLGFVTSTFIVGGNGSSGRQTQFTGKLASTSATTVDAARVTTNFDDESWGVFGSWQLGLFEQFYFTLGVRGERNRNYGRNHQMDWTPANGVTYTFEHRDLSVKLLGSYGRTTRTPSADYRLQKISVLSGYTIPQYVYQLEAPNLTPEYSRGPQGGMEVYYGNRWSFTVNHYQQTVTDLIQAVPVDTTFAGVIGSDFIAALVTNQYQNVAKVRQRGWEGTASVNVGPLSVKGAYSWNDSRILEVNPYATSSGYAPGESFRWVPTHTGSITASYAVGATSVTWVTNYVGASIQPFRWTPERTVLYQSRLQMYSGWGRIPSGYQSTDGYAKSNLAASHRVTSWISATLNVTNITNNFGSEASGLFPSLGRKTLLGVSLRSR